jgi:hypothetical protein
MSNTVEFAGDGGKIVIEIFGYERPVAPDVDMDDANWLDGKLIAEAGAFRGSFRISLMTTELIGFHKELGKTVEMLSGKVEFNSLESDLDLAISFGQHGSAEIRGVLRPGGWSPGVLHFQFQSDQSYLSKSVRDLESLTRQFPFRDVRPV